MSVEAPKQTYYPEVQVRNKVLWVNPNIYLPFPLISGESTRLGVFVVKPQAVSSGFMGLGVNHYHGRSAYLGSAEIADCQGNIYRDIDLKGIGYLKEERSDLAKGPQVAPIENRNSEATNGLWRLEKAQREIRITEDLHSRGVRTYRIGALIGLEEIALPDGTILSIEEAKAKGMIHVEEQPVIGLRLYRFRERIEHMSSERMQIMNTARNRLEKELGTTIGWQEFLSWFSVTLGSNLAAIHNAGYWHGSLDPHNITLAAEIIDFGLDYGLNSFTFSKKLADLNIQERGHEIRHDYNRAYDCVGAVVGDIQWGIKKREELIVGTHFGKMFYKAYVDRIADHKAPVEEPGNARSLRLESFSTTVREPRNFLENLRAKLSRRGSS